MTLDKLIAQLTALSDKGCGAKMDGGGKAKAKEEKEGEMDACRLTKKLS